MNLKKVNKELLNSIMSKNRKLQMYPYKEGKALYMPDVYHAFVINDEDMYFDQNKMKKCVFPFCENNLDDLVITDYAHISTTGKIARRYICKSKNIYIDEKYLKCFDYPVLRGTDENKPVYVYEFNELVGLIAPIIVKEK